MESMFENCHSLISLNLKNFNTKKVVNMNKMFYNCTSLISLDLRSFDISLVANAENIFNNCNSLLYINLISFEEKYNYTNLFENISSDLVYCIDEVKSPTISKAFKSHGLINNCSDICFLDTKKINIEKRECIIYCENSEI
jgi:surface protein